MKSAKKIILVLLVLSLAATAALAQTKIGTTANGDGYAGRSWYGWVGSWATTDEQAVRFWHSGSNRESGRGVVIFDISALAGKTFQPGSVSLNFYSFGIGGTSLQFYGGDPGDSVVAGFSQAGGEAIASLDGVGEGWQSYDVTNHVSSAVQNGWGHVGFMFNVTTNETGGSIAAFEDLEGRGAYLEVVPEPSGLVSMLSAMAGFGGLLFKRRIR